jgi:hypothetical protein
MTVSAAKQKFDDELPYFRLRLQAARGMSVRLVFRYPFP